MLKMYKEISYIKLFDTKKGMVVEFTAKDRSLSKDEINEVSELILSDKMQLCKIKGKL